MNSITNFGSKGNTIRDDIMLGNSCAKLVKSCGSYPQLCNASRTTLRSIDYRGFDKPRLDSWQYVQKSHCGCSAAINEGKQIIVEKNLYGHFCDSTILIPIISNYYYKPSQKLVERQQYFGGQA